MYEQTQKQNPAEKHVDVKLTFTCLIYKSYMTFNKLLYIRTCNRFQDNKKILCNSLAFSRYYIFTLRFSRNYVKKNISMCKMYIHIHIKSNDKFPMRQNTKFYATVSLFLSIISYLYVSIEIISMEVFHMNNNKLLCIRRM